MSSPSQAQWTESDIRLNGRRPMLVAVVLGVAGLALSALLARGGAQAHAQFFRSYLVSFVFFLSLGLGGLFFVLITHLTRAGWGVALRRVAEAVTWTLPLLGLFSLVVYAGRHELYEWTHAEAVATDALLQHKSGWLDEGFFLVRLGVYFAVWTAMMFYFSRKSTRQDRTGDPAATITMERVAAPATILYALTLTFAAFDLLMSLYPHWYSTIFGVYYFAGSVLGMFSLVTLLVVLLQRAGKLSQLVTAEHYHDLGKLMFAFVVFWAYIAFSQYMLIWYAHIPEETSWYLARQTGPWAAVSLGLLFGHFVVPFLWLISRHPKRSPAVLAVAAVWVLAMHWLDLYWLVMPEVSPDRIPLSLLDLSTLVGVGGAFFAVVFWRLSATSLIPVRDPRIQESLGLENA